MTLANKEANMKALILTIVTFLFTLPALADHMAQANWEFGDQCGPVDQLAPVIVFQWGEEPIHAEEGVDTTTTWWWNRASNTYTITEFHRVDQMLCVLEVGEGNPVH